jgi:multicomponent Na+:H+ antiporter subunit D
MAHLVGGSLLLGGVLWHLAAVGSLDFGDLTGSPGAALVLLAVLLAAAAPPLHAWLPDAYPSASVTGTVVLAAFTTKAAVYALVRGFSGLDVLVPVGVVMALYGVVYAVLEDDLRRLLSYHIVSQVGFMVAAVGVAGPAAANGATAHAVAHILYKGLLLMGAGAVIMATGRSRLSELGGLGRRMPLVFTCTVIGALSISGLPLFSGFVSKELAVDAVRGTDLGWAVQALKVASVGTFLSVGLKLVWFSFGGPDRGLRPTRLPASVLVALVVGAALNVLIGLRPGLLYDLLPHAVAFQPFVAKQVADTLQLLGLTALVFVWLRDRVRPSPGLSLDVDWVVRGLPLLVRSRLAAARPAGGWSAPVQAVRDRTRRLADTAAAAVIDRVPAATPSTTALGGVLLAALGVVLVRSVLP